MKRQVARELVVKVTDVLNRDWDPIGDCPDDEYDSYAGSLVALMNRGATDAELLAFLKNAEEELIGLSRFDVERGMRVVAALQSVR